MLNIPVFTNPTFCFTIEITLKKGGGLIDTRIVIIDDILMSLQPELSKKQLNFTRDVLYSEFEQYEVIGRCTDVAIRDNSSEMMLKKFIGAKRVEGKSEKTIEQYILRCSDMIYTIDKPVEDINVFDLRYYLADFKEKRHVSNRTLENVRRCISSFFGWLYNEGFIDENPCIALGTIKYEKKIRMPFSDVDMEKLRRACDTKRNRAIIEFLYSTGCRVSEMVSLDRDNVDFASKKVIVTGKGDKQRTVFLSDVAIMYLQEYLESRKDDDVCLFASGRPRPDHSRRFAANGVETMLKKLGERAGVENCHPHRFRRTFATNMIRRGASIQETAILLGHEDIATTQVYVSISQQSVQDSYQRCIA